MLTQEYQRIPALRNCPRCGTDFRSGGTERVCQACRRPEGGIRPMRRDLSFREKQVVDLVRQAKANKEIAYQLHLSEGTVKEYLNRIFRKLEVSNRTELAVWAMNHRAEFVVIQLPDSAMSEKLLVNQ
jgi:DNA-binding CsgD family transcriptional regulator